MKKDQYRRVAATPAEIEAWKKLHNGQYPAMYRVECTICGKRIWGSGMGIGAHNRSSKCVRPGPSKEEVDKACAQLKVEMESPEFAKLVAAFPPEIKKDIEDAAKKAAERVVAIQRKAGRIMESDWVAPGTGSSVREIAAAVALSEDGSKEWIEANNAVVELRHMVGPDYQTRLKVGMTRLQLYSLERVAALPDWTKDEISKSS